MQAAIPSLHLFQLREGSKDANEVLFPTERITPLSEDQCLTRLGSAPKLGNEQSRAALLKRLLRHPTSSKGSTNRTALRYLLHGQQQDTGVTLLCAGQSPHQALAKLISHLLAKGNQAWRLIAEALNGVVAPQDRPFLGMKDFSPTLAAELIEENGTEALEDLTLSPSEQEELLIALRDAECWLNLPLHRADGRDQPTSAKKPSTYYQQPYEVPGYLEDQVTIISTPKSQPLSELYENYVSRGKLRKWDWEALLEETLLVEDCHLHADRILSALQDCPQGLQALPDGLNASLRSRPWLPTRHGGSATSPLRVITLPGLESTIERLVSLRCKVGEQAPLVDIGSLDESITGHALFDEVKASLLLSAIDSAATLARELVHIPAYPVGALNKVGATAIDSQTLLTAFGPECIGNDPVLSLLKNVASVDLKASQELFLGLCAPIHQDRLLSYMDQLSNDSACSDGTRRSVCTHVFNAYLELMMSGLSDLDRFPYSIRLLNEKGEWRSTSELCFNHHSLDKRCILDETQEKLIRTKFKSDALQHRMPTHSERRSSDGVEIHVPDTIDQFFHYWSGPGVEQCIGGFLSMAGDGEDVRSLAERLLRPRYSVDQIRRYIDLPRMNSNGTTDSATSISKIRVEFVFIAGDSDSGMTLTALDGSDIYVGFDANASSIIIGRPETIPMSMSGMNRLFGGVIFPFRVRLRVIDLNKISPMTLKAIITESAHHLIRGLYNFHCLQLREMMRELGDTGQIDLSVAQRVLIKSLFMSARQMEFSPSSDVRTLVREWGDAEYSGFELQNGLDASDVVVRVTSDRQAALAHKMKALLENDTQARVEVLEAVRAKVISSSYAADSVLFELWQNADDACVELAQMSEPSNPTQLESIGIHIGEEYATLVHYGRPINQYCVPGFQGEQGRRLGYHDDLVKMLLLSASDKTSAEGAVTGKFGLGFKSVFLVCDSPRVLSGQIAFDVLAGMYPKELDESGKTHILRSLRELGLSDEACTAIQLPWRSDLPSEERQSSYSRMFDLVHILVVFSRRMKTCHLHLEGESIVIRWSADSLTEKSRLCFVGELRGRAPSDAHGELALHLNCGESGSVLFRLDRRGVTRFDPKVPTYWVTAPTRQELGLGLLLNAPFSLDLGRSQLPLFWPENRSIAERLGGNLGDAFLEWFDSTADWHAASAKMGLDPDVDRKQFWNSVWDLLGDGLQRRHSALGADADRTEDQWMIPLLAFWSNSAGMGRLASERACLPSGLTGVFNVLVRYPLLKWVAEGLLDSVGLLEVVWPEIEALPIFQSLRPGTIGSRSRLVAPLESLLEISLPVEPLRLSDVLDHGFAVEISPEDAKRLHGVFSVEPLDELMRPNRPGEPDPERDELQAWLRLRRFRSRCGEFRDSTSLLIPAMDGEQAVLEDEGLIAGFAPPEWLLSGEYLGASVKCVRLCRAVPAYHPEALAQWGLAAEGQAARLSFLRYLADGANREEREAVLEFVRRHVEDSWLTDLELLATYEALVGSQVSRTLLLLELVDSQRLFAPAFPEDAEDWETGASDMWGRGSELPPPDAFRRIWTWWNAERDRYNERYDYDTYPDVAGIWSSITSRRSGTLEEREAWLLLFLRGALETVGLGPESKRNFMRFFRDNSVFQRIWEDPGNAEAIVGAAASYFELCEAEVKWFNWIKVTIPVLILSRWLDEYIEAFLSLNHGGTSVDLSRILRPRTNQDFSRGGPDAPPLVIFGQIGGHFVSRELVRHRIIHREDFHAVCYVPSARVCRMLAGLGVRVPPRGRMQQSEAILAAMIQELGSEHATFFNDFDVPLWVLASDPVLKNEVLFSSNYQVERDE